MAKRQTSVFVSAGPGLGSLDPLYTRQSFTGGVSLGDEQWQSGVSAYLERRRSGDGERYTTDVVERRCQPAPSDNGPPKRSMDAWSGHWAVGSAHPFQAGGPPANQSPASDPMTPSRFPSNKPQAPSKPGCLRCGASQVYACKHGQAIYHGTWKEYDSGCAYTDPASTLRSILA
ncbi:hypothetical protein JX266_004488 [Neoarthrinium moseri]|nr:hypothetical protein JX266_004488 [Neoarthrinium moseri]